MSKKSRGPSQPHSPEQDPHVSSHVIRAYLHERMRTSALQVLYQIFEEEVESLCGKPYSRSSDDKPRRAGSDKGSVFWKGQKVSVRKPRIKQGDQEIHLQSYQMLQDPALMLPYVQQAMLSGVSTRHYQALQEQIPGGKGISSSSISRAFKKASRNALHTLNSRDLASENIVILMADAMHIGKRAVIGVLGITATGCKLFLGIREGDSENSEVAKDLLASLIERGLKKEALSLIVLDGGKALRTAVRACWGEDVPVQRCAIHKERNILGYLPKAHHQEFRRKWKMLHGCVNYQEALRLHRTLETWLSQINLAALQSLEEAKQETLTVIRFQIPALLRTTLIATNPIESCFASTRRTIRRVKNWNQSSDQMLRWVAVATLDAETRFRTIKGYREIPLLMETVLKHNQ